MSDPSPARRVLAMFATKQGRDAATIAELRCQKGHLLLTLFEAPQDGFVAEWPKTRMPRPPSAWRRSGWTPPAERPTAGPEPALFIPKLLDELRTRGLYEGKRFGARCPCCPTFGEFRIPLSYLAEITAAGRGQGVVIADPQRVRSASQP